MIAAVLWLYVAVHLLIAEGWLATLGVRLDVSACACLFASLFARLRALPLLLLGTALARSVFLSGDVALHFLSLGIPVGVLVPLRRLFTGGNPLWQAACAMALAAVVPKLTCALADALGQDVQAAPASLGAVLQSALLVPVVTLVLRKLPPLSTLAEPSR